MIADEEPLRARAMVDADDAHVLADAYERDGQLQRARLWRGFAMSHRALLDGAPPDLIARRHRKTDKVDPRRDAMIWLLTALPEGRFRTQRITALRFGLSTTTMRNRASRGWRGIAYAAALETARPTMLATNRLVAARALRRPRYTDPHIGDVELPPDDFPRVHRIIFGGLKHGERGIVTTRIVRNVR